MMYQLSVFDGRGVVLANIVKNTLVSPWYYCIGESAVREITVIPVLWKYMPVWKKLKNLFVSAYQPLTLRVYHYESFVFGLSDITPEETLQALVKCIDNPERYIEEMME